MIASVMNINLLRLTMNKLLAASAATLLAMTAIASGAQAGFNVSIKVAAGFSELHKAGCGGGGRVASQSVRRSKPRAEVASRSVRKSVVVAKVESEAPKAPQVADEKANVAQIESSSITGEKVAEIKASKAEKTVAEKPAEKAVVASANVGCKKFFPSVGLTLSVPCDAN